MCGGGYKPGGAPKSRQVRRHLPEARRPNQTGWIRNPKRFGALGAFVAHHLEQWRHDIWWPVRLVPAIPMAWRLDTHDDGCPYLETRFARALVALRIAR